MEELISLKIFVGLVFVSLGKYASDYHWELINNDDSSEKEFFLALWATAIGLCGLILGAILIYQDIFTEDPLSGRWDGFIFAFYVLWRSAAATKRNQEFEPS